MSNPPIVIVEPDISEVRGPIPHIASGSNADENMTEAQETSLKACNLDLSKKED